MQKPHFIEHSGKQIFVVDFSGFSVEDRQPAADVLQQAKEVIGQQGQQSLLVLTKLEGAQFDKKAVHDMRQYMIHNKPYIKRSAITGLSGLAAGVYHASRLLTRRNIPLFSTDQEAMDWLIQEQ